MEPRRRARGHRLVPLSPEYAAGFFDGEGHISILVTRPNKKHPTAFHRLRVGVSQKASHREVLDELAEMFGGAVYVRNSKKREALRWSIQADWVITRISDAEAFLRAIEPYIVVKREQIRVGLAFLASRTLSARWTNAAGQFMGRRPLDLAEFELREGFRQQMLELNRLGTARVSRTTRATLDYETYRSLN